MSARSMTCGVATVAVCCVAAFATVTSAAEWRDFRGVGADGGATLPAEWSLEESTGVAWQAELPGRGVSGPIVVDGRVVVTGSDGPSRQRLHVAAYDDKTGEELWLRRFSAAGRTFCHETSANAAPTPATDGERVYAFFSSNELVALDLDGNVQWVRCLALDHPGVGNDVGMASSPVVIDGVVVVQAECQRNSFAIAVDARTGQTRWELERPASSNWTTPLATTLDDGRAIVLLQSREGLVAYTASGGEKVWELQMECDGVPSIAKAGERITVASDGLLTSLRLNGPAAPELDWRTTALAPGSPSPVFAGERVVIVNRSGVVVCGAGESSDVLWRRRLRGRFWATPAVSGGRGLFVNADGKAWVLDLENNGRIVLEADFGEPVLASPAATGGALYVRSYTRLWKIGPDATDAPGG
ncbi:MAG: PQQ-binding-like beta-propeller repeat protein [Planctomycetota bacterium]